MNYIVGCFNDDLIYYNYSIFICTCIYMNLCIYIHACYVKHDFFF